MGEEGYAHVSPGPALTLKPGVPAPPAAFRVFPLSEQVDVHGMLMEVLWAVSLGTFRGDEAQNGANAQARSI